MTNDWNNGGPLAAVPYSIESPQANRFLVTTSSHRAKRDIALDAKEGMAAFLMCRGLLGADRAISLGDTMATGCANQAHWQTLTRCLQMNLKLSLEKGFKGWLAMLQTPHLSTL